MEDSHGFIKLPHANEMLRDLVAYVCGAVVLIAPCQTELLPRFAMALVALVEAALNGTKVSERIEMLTRPITIFSH